MSGYIFDFNGKAFTPDGMVTTKNACDIEAHNDALAMAEIAAIERDKPERLFLYVGNNGDLDTVQTWTGKYLGLAWLGQRATIGGFCRGFGHNYRRPITARIFGTLYHGWFYESSGDYCRLKKAKQQVGNYRATTVLRPKQGGN